MSLVTKITQNYSVKDLKDPNIVAQKPLLVGENNQSFMRFYSSLKITQMVFMSMLTKIF